MSKTPQTGFYHPQHGRLVALATRVPVLDHDQETMCLLSTLRLLQVNMGDAPVLSSGMDSCLSDLSRSSPDLAKSLQILPDLSRLCQISPDPLQTLPDPSRGCQISPDLIRSLQTLSRPSQISPDRVTSLQTSADLVRSLQILFMPCQIPPVLVRSLRNSSNLAMYLQTLPDLSGPCRISPDFSSPCQITPDLVRPLQTWRKSDKKWPFWHIQRPKVQGRKKGTEHSLWVQLCIDIQKVSMGK